MTGRLSPIEHNGQTRVPVIALCRIDECKFEWPIVYTPCPIDVFANAGKRGTCPMCGDKRPLLKGNGNEDKPDLTMEIKV